MLADLEKANKVPVKMAEKAPQNSDSSLLAELRRKFGVFTERSALLDAELAYVVKARKGRPEENISFVQLQQRCEKAVAQLN